MAGLRSRSKQGKLFPPTTYRRKGGGAIQPSRNSIASKQAIFCDLPDKLSPTKAELALWRAFLAEEIDAILRDDGE